MRTLEELWLLAAETLSLWLRNLPRLGTWYLVGWVVFTLGQHASVQLGAAHRTEATLVFVLGVIAQVLSVILMIHSLEPSLRTPADLARRDDPSLPVPPGLWQLESRTDVALYAIGPFLGVYAVWGLVDQWVKDLFFINQAVLGTDTKAWSVSLRGQTTFYLVLAGVALVLRWVVGALVKRRRTPWLVLPLLFLEGLWVFASFFVFLQWAEDVHMWLSRREVTTWVLDAADRVAAALPDIHLPFGWHLPALVSEMGRWIGGSFLPGAWHGILLPLMWLALAATVFGWRDVTLRDAVAGTRAAAALDRLAPRDGSDTVLGSVGRAVRSVVGFATADLRDKWLPIAHALRMVWRSGPRFLAAYLVLATLIDVGQYWLAWLVHQVRGPLQEWDLLLWLPVSGMLVGLVGMTLSMALYAAAFDRAIADVTGAGWRERRRARALLPAPERAAVEHAWDAPTGAPVVPAWPAPLDPPAYPTTQ